MYGTVRTHNSQGKGGHEDAWAIGAALKKVQLIGQYGKAGSYFKRVDEDGSGRLSPQLIHGKLYLE